MGKYVNSRRLNFLSSGDCCDCNRAEYSIAFCYRQEEQNKKKENRHCIETGSVFCINYSVTAEAATFSFSGNIFLKIRRMNGPQ